MNHKGIWKLHILPKIWKIGKKQITNMEKKSNIRAPASRAKKRVINPITFVSA